MKLSVSNIAWNTEDDDKVALFLKKSGIEYVEIAPTKYFPKAPFVGEEEILTIRDSWNARNFNISSIQSLFYGHREIQLVDQREDQKSIIDFLLAWGSIAESLGASSLVLGGPNNRKLNSLTSTEANFKFQSLINTLEKSWVWKNQLALEANPIEYGCEFITQTSDAINVVQTIQSTVLGWNLDTACTILAGENPIELLSSDNELPAHVHISSPLLAPLNHSASDSNKSLIRELNKLNYSGFVTLEMKSTPNINDLYKSIELFCGYFS
jgi:D-psicose/D-tagatose/L-ribulose 3-epimerase